MNLQYFSKIHCHKGYIAVTHKLGEEYMKSCLSEVSPLVQNKRSDCNLKLNFIYATCHSYRVSGCFCCTMRLTCWRTSTRRTFLALPLSKSHSKRSLVFVRYSDYLKSDMLLISIISLSMIGWIKFIFCAASFKRLIKEVMFLGRILSNLICQCAVLF